MVLGFDAILNQSSSIRFVYNLIVPGGKAAHGLTVFCAFMTLLCFILMREPCAGRKRSETNARTPA